MKNGKGITRHGSASLFALCACCIMLAVSCKEAPKLDAGPHVALGQTAAATTAELLQNKGNVVLLVGSDEKPPTTGPGKAVESFREALTNSGVQVQAVEVIPEANAPLLSGMEPVSADKFLELIRKHASADAIVSFVGAPRFNSQQAAQLPNPRPKFIAAVTYNPPLRAMFSSGIIHAAIIARSGVVQDSQVQDPAGVFEANFQLIRAGNANLLPF